MIPRYNRAAGLMVALLVTALLSPACAAQREPDPGPSDSPGASPSTPASPRVPPRSPRGRPAEESPTVVPPEPPAPPAPPFPGYLAGKDLERLPTDRPIVALTFDAGANADAVGPILATLATERVAATFFLTGDFVRRFPAESGAIVTAGHRLGNHSATHPHFTSLTTSHLRDEVTRAEADIRSRAGGDPAPFFRFPYGDRDARTIAAVNDLGYVAVRWTVDTLGWQGTTGGRSAAEVTQRVLDTAQPGQIVLMHVGSHPTDGSTLDADALPSVIAGLRQRGYSFVTLNVLLSDTVSP
jgi:peptidoglycan/xylan/chitin deacetylase (PgdA/CDA1 family)